MTANDLTVLVNTWYLLFAKLDKQVVEVAFMQALSKAKFPVVPANVLEIINAQSKAKLPTTDELFDMAYKAALQIEKHYSYDNGWSNTFGDPKSGYEHAKEIYGKLPAILREWKHSPLDFIRWLNTISDENESFIRHEFKEIMGDRLNRRETLGIGFNDEFNPRFDFLTGCMKSIDGDDKKGLLNGGGV
jgi:hypothetical protein